MKKETYKIINYAILVLLLLMFFVKIIPIPVENIEGDKDKDNFIFGGFYYTSGLYELSVQDYSGSIALLGIFIVLFTGNKLFYINNK